MKQTILICPRNDEESLMILKIAESIGVQTIVSAQPHGATLGLEKNIIDRARMLNAKVERLVIVELPGIEEENKLKDAGLEVAIIDHHRYDGLDRMNMKSSLEQFLDLFEVDDAKLENLGFDPLLVSSVAAMDRGFIWELKKQGLSKEDFDRSLEYYRELTMEVEGDRRLREEEVARSAWEKRKERGEIIIVESEDAKTSIRDPISFLVAKEWDEPKTIFIIQGNRRMYVQDSGKAPILHQRFGGFTFGQDRCWGILKEDGNLPSVDDILAIIVE